MRKIVYIHIITLLVSFSGYCQILDDSTKQIYSSKTTLFYSLDDVFYNTNQKKQIDTSLLNLHNYNYYFKNGILYQDLGNFGTPLNRIYYEPPTTIGKRLGFSTLTEYGYDPEKINFFDTKSPYTRLFYIQGSKGQQSLEVQHTRNIKPNWNIGFSLKRMISIKQLAVGASKEQQMSHYSFNTHTSYHSKNKRYSVLFNYTLLDHSQYENGGIFVDSLDTKADMFEYRLEEVQLYSLPNSRLSKTRLRSYNKKSHFQLYNQYSITPGSGLQLFHKFDYEINTVRYDDDYLYDRGVQRNILYYPTNQYYDTLTTHDRIISEFYENKAGIKGAASKLFYMAYFRRRDFSYVQTNYVGVVRRYQENFVGGAAEFRFSDTMAISAKAEYFIGRDYLLDFQFRSRFIDLGYKKISYSPSLFQLVNFSNSYRWENNFSNTNTDYLYVTGKLETKNFFFSPFANLANINRLIYFDTLSLPTQSNKAVQQLSAGVWAKVRWGILNVEDYFRYTNVAGSDVLRVPEIFNQARIYLYGALFKKALRLQIGVDLSWKSGYYGNAYAPGTQQFHLSDRNNNFNYLDGYLLGDVFLNTQIKRGFIFLKFSHVNQGLPKAGYFITPYYTGLPRTFEFGVRWLFYD